MSEVSGGAIPICNGEAAFNVALNKLVLIERWFIVTLTWRIHPPIVGCWCVKTPIWACSGERKAWGVVVPVYTGVPGARGLSRWVAVAQVLPKAGRVYST